MGERGKAAGSGVGVLGLLGVAFVVLKLCGVIDWPWAWVLAPFWVPLALLAVFLLFLCVIYALLKVFSGGGPRRRYW